MPDRVSVRVRDCACPNTPHAEEGDVVFLEPTLPLDGGILAEQQLIASAGDGPKLTREWLRTFIEFGATGWNLLDEDGDEVDFDIATILGDWSLARPLADKAADLYSDSVTAPFLRAQAVRSPTGQTAATTSRTRRRTPSS